MSDIKEKVKRIGSMQERLGLELRQVQEACPHSSKEGQYKSDTGNYCPEEDSYWIAAKCLECNKVWSIDSKVDNVEYYTFTGRKVK